MKTRRRINHFVVAISFLLSAGCSEGGLLLAPADDRAVGRVDWIPWSGAASARLHGAVGEQVLTIHAEAPREEHLVIMIPFAGPGRYQLAPDQISLGFTIGGDVSIGRYGGRAFSGGELRITEFDGVGGVMRAEFHLLLTHEQGDQRYGSTAEFTGGRVHARVVASWPGGL